MLHVPVAHGCTVSHLDHDVEHYRPRGPADSCLDAIDYAGTSAAGAAAVEEAAAERAALARGFAVLFVACAAYKTAALAQKQCQDLDETQAQETDGESTNCGEQPPEVVAIKVLKRAAAAAAAIGSDCAQPHEIDVATHIRDACGDGAVRHCIERCTRRRRWLCRRRGHGGGA